MTAPVAGLTTSNVWPSAASTASPPMTMRAVVTAELAVGVVMTGPLSCCVAWRRIHGADHTPDPAGPGTPAQDRSCAVHVPPQADHDPAQLRAGDAHPLEGVPGELEGRLGIRIGQPADAEPAQHVDLPPPARPRSDRQPRVDPERPLRGQAGRQRVADRDDQDARSLEVEPPEDLGIGRVAEDVDGAEALERLELAGVSIDDHAAKTSEPDGPGNDLADPAGAEDDDRRPARLVLLVERLLGSRQLGGGSRRTTRPSTAGPPASAGRRRRSSRPTRRSAIRPTSGLAGWSRPPCPGSGCRSGRRAASGRGRCRPG